jgi:hypothetical protein
MKLQEYEELVMKHRPHLKPISAHTYAVSLKSIEPEGAEHAKWIEDTKYVLKQLEKYKETTRKNTLNALIVVLPSQGKPGATAKYVKERDKYNEMYAEQSKAHKKTESQEKNWTEWPDYLAMVSEMKSDLAVLAGKSEAKDWTWRETLRYQDYVIASLYSFYPLRNDFGDVEVVSKSAFNNTTHEERKKQNYLVKEQAKMSLVLNEYKTSKKYGEKTIDIDPEVRKVLLLWFKHNRSGFLLADKKGQALGSNGITKSLAKVGLQRLQKRLGSSLLRHSYLSHKYSKTTQEKEKDADLMMHSVAMQDGYIKT